MAINTMSKNTTAQKRHGPLMKVSNHLISNEGHKANPHLF